MANWDNLKSAVSAVIKENGNGEITGQVLQNTLNNIISVIGANATFVGVATPSTNPGTLDSNSFYIAAKKGIYPNFGGYEVTENAVIFSNASGEWAATKLAVASLDFVSESVASDMAYSGYPYVHLGHLYEGTQGSNGRYIESLNWDCAIIRIYKDSGTLEIVGATAGATFFFDSLEIADTYLQYSGLATGIPIPKGAKLCVIDFRKANNPNGYKDLRIRQVGSGVDREELQIAEMGLLGNAFTLEAQCIHTNGKLYPNVVGLNATEFLRLSGKNAITIVGGWGYSAGNIVAYAFYDKDKNLISTSQGTGLVNTTIPVEDIPEGAAYIRGTANILQQPNPYIKGALSLASIAAEVVTRVDREELQTTKMELLGELGLSSYKSGDSIEGTEVGGYMRDNGTILVAADFVHTVYDIDATKKYRVHIPPYYQDSLINLVKVKNASGSVISSIIPLDNPGNREIDAILILPENATQIIVNWRKEQGSAPSVYEVTTQIDNVGNAIKKSITEDCFELSDTAGYFINSSGVPSKNSYFHYVKFDVSDKSKQYRVTTGIGDNSELSAVHYYDAEGNWLGLEHYMVGPIRIVNTLLHVPEKAVYIYVNANTYNTPALTQTAQGEFYDLASIAAASKGDKLMKVHIYALEPSANSDAFYIRTKYNSAKDIIIRYYINKNTLISPYASYVGSNELADSELMATTYLVSSHDDSTAPFLNSSVYWHLFAQHGYVIPRISNTVGMTSADVGAIWKDQLGRQYTIGDVTDSSISLLPVLTRGLEEGADTRGWKTPFDTAITTFTHVSGGSYTTTFAVTALSVTQLRPIMEHYNRHWLVDGAEISEAGDYLCDEFKVSESQIGYDPATINTWFPTPVLDGALEMARFTWSYNFKGANCAVNTTVAVMRKLECQSYGACQQQFFLDKGSYKAMFLIPKLKPQSGIDPSKPFNSPSKSGADLGYWRNSTYLIDENDPVDRQIGYLYDEDANDYLVGMAAGLSLVSGDTVKAKRIQNIAVSTTNGHGRLGSFSPSNTNKFYIAAVNTAPFADDAYNFPNTYFKEINYYVSYFDPSENEGQVYWYKDGNSYVIYAHCQSAHNRLAIKLPKFMEGLKVEVIEKTAGTTLLTDTIQNDNLFVTYTADANYIVLKAK